MAGSRLIDLTGQVFGEWTVIKRISNSRSGHTVWLCECSPGVGVGVLSTHLITGKSKSCGCMRPRQAERKQWTGYGQITGQFWNQILVSATGGKRRPLEFEITIEYIDQLFTDQKGLCALTGLPIAVMVKYGDARSASLDRIDSSRGYLPDNVQWVHKDINRMKNNYTEEYFIEMCRLVVDTATSGQCDL